MVKKVKNTVSWKYVTTGLNGEEIVGIFYKKRVEKVIKIKVDKLYVIWKGYDNYFNSCIDKKDIV